MKDDRMIRDWMEGGRIIGWKGTRWYSTRWKGK